MNRGGCFGLVLGGLAGLLVAMLLLVATRQAASPVVEPSLPSAPADVTLFLSGPSLSRFASASRKSPTLVEFAPGGQMEITTQIDMGGVRPVVSSGFSLEVQAAGVVSRLEWVKLGFIKFPAGWLPQEIVQLGATPGEVITRQLPPEFKLMGLTTTPDGIQFQLNWIK